MVPMLKLAGHEVVGLDIDFYERCTFGNQPSEIRFIKKDIRDITAAELEGFNAIIHLAALSNDPLGNLNPQLTYDINYHATIRLAKLAKEAGIERFLFSSSCSNYGSAGEEYINEDSAFNPVTPYGISKVLAEQDLSKLANDDFTPTFLRSATAYGVSPRLRFDLVLNNLTAWGFTTGRVYIKSDGNAWRPIVHIEDISLAFMAVLHADRDQVHNQAFNVGRTQENYRIRDIAEIVEAVVPECRIEYAQNGESDKRCYRVNCDKITQTLEEFQPKWTAYRGAEQLYEEYQNVGLSLRDFEGSRYQRIAHIKKTN